MKKYVSLLAVVALLAALTGCGGTSANSKAPAYTTAGGSVSQILEAAANDAVPVADAAEWDESDAEWDTEELYGVEAAQASAHDGIDVDLTRMSSTMVYGQVSGMMYTPEDYLGKTVRMNGVSYSSYYDETDTTYYYILISDATACCAQGLEYVLADGVKYPEDETTATITGVFETYDELGMTYCRLKDATVSA